MPDEFNPPGILFWRRPTLARPFVALPSGLQRFTSVFGMGTGGATALISPELNDGNAVAQFWCVIRDSLHRYNGVPSGSQFNVLTIHGSLFTEPLVL